MQTNLCTRMGQQKTLNERLTSGQLDQASLWRDEVQKTQHVLIARGRRAFPLMESHMTRLRQDKTDSLEAQHGNSFDEGKVC